MSLPRPLPTAALRWLLAVGLLASACATAVNPATGRRQVVLMSHEDEERVDAEAAREVEATLGLVRDPKLNAYVSRVGEALAAHSPRQDVDYRFLIVEMDEPNAFALPGGHVYVSRGLLLLTNTESELAHVLGHEIGHVAARHAVARDAHVKTLGVATVLGDILSGGSERLPESESLGGDPIARYARNQEREADRIGQEIATQSGVEPAGMARFLLTLENYTKLSQGFSTPQTYFATHPTTRERLAEAATQAQAQAWRSSPGSPAEGWSYARAREAYLDQIEGMAVGRPASEGVFVDDRFLHPDLGFSLRFPHGWETQNQASSVVAVAPKRDGVVLLQLQGAGADPIAAAREYAEHEGLVLQRATPVRIGELPAFRAEAAVMSPYGPIAAEITWIAYGGRIYRLLGGAEKGRIRKYEGVLRKVAQSFRPLSPDDARAVTELRLRTARSLPGETLEALSKRSGNAWDLAYTAVSNALFVDDVLQAGQRIKIAVSEPYVATPAPPPTPAEGTTAPDSARAPDAGTSPPPP